MPMIISELGLKSDALQGETVIVTGAGGGIGYAAARALLWLGANVVIAEINHQNGRKAEHGLEGEFGNDRVLFVQTDVGDEASVRNLYNLSVLAFGQVDAVLNNATIAVLGQVKDLPIEEWDKSYHVNLRGPVLMAKTFLPEMIQRNHGVFVCVSSTGTAFLGGYETFKAAQVHLANTLDAELEGTNVIAYTIGPGLVPTETASKAIEQLAPQMGMSVETFFEMNKGAVLSVEEAGAGFAASIVFAEKFRGQEISSIQALKAADIGVAMGITGTDVAKETADMVLTDDNYASIVAAVEQGRIIYANIRKFVFFLLSSNVAEIMIIFLATLAGLPAPLTAIQLLWLNLITDGAPALALAVEKGDPDIMHQKPRAKNEPIVNRSMLVGLIVQTFAQTGAVLSAFALGLLWHLEAGAAVSGNPLVYILQHDWRDVDVQTAETMAFATLSLCELFRAYTVRSERASLFSIGIFSNRYMQYAVGLSIVLLLLVVNVPFLQPIFNTHAPSLREWGVVIGLALIPAVAEEITKIFLRRR